MKRDATRKTRKPAVFHALLDANGIRWWGFPPDDTYALHDIGVFVETFGGYSNKGFVRAVEIACARKSLRDL